MPAICFYFQVHQPKRLKPYSLFNITNHQNYEHDDLNRTIILKVAEKCYLPTNALMHRLIQKYEGAFRIAYSISGTAIEQFKQFYPAVLDSFKKLADTGCVEFLNETYYHSLSFLYSKEEFLQQIGKHRDLIAQEFNQHGETFRNTELIYHNEIGQWISDLGYKTVLVEGAEKILNNRNPCHIYQSIHENPINLLLRHYQLSDDIAFRFSNKQWIEHPLTAEKITHWMNHKSHKNDTINLFMDYETFGEHQWRDCGIFDFLEALPKEILKCPNLYFATPKEVVKKNIPRDILNVPYYCSWADQERDLTAWCGNVLQEDALKKLFALRESVYATKNSELIKIWQSLSTSDHFYYMCTKSASDGDVHKYFSHYRTPYEAYMNFKNVLNDLKRITHDGFSKIQE